MLRLFETYRKRKAYSLEGMWDFKIDPLKEGIGEQWYKNFPIDSSSIVVPSCWNNEFGLYDYEGVAWYRRFFRISSDIVNLSFEGVTGQAMVYVDGNYIGEHYGGFTPFHLLVRDLAEGEHSLVVAVDNTHNDVDTIPLAKVDWFHYGGIIRNVQAAELSKAWIKDYKIDYKLEEDLKNADLSFTVHLESLRNNNYEGKLNILIEDTLIYSEGVVCNKEGTIKVLSCPFKDIKLWNVGKPELYRIRFELEGSTGIVDDTSDRIGFRTVKIQGRKLYINGEETYLKGVCRHEEHPDWGFALPEKLMKKDIDIIKDMGGNAIRGSHYPNSRAFLDFCDEAGLLFWEEIPLWQYRERHFNNPLVLERSLTMLEEMIHRDYHHPSIIMWGVHNEVETSCQAGFYATKLFTDKVRSLDSTRLVTYASFSPFNDLCFGLVDVISINKYYGWYEGNLESWEEFLRTFKIKMEEDGYGDKPIIMSEFGAAGLYGDCTFESPKWTENYQEKLLEYTLNLFRKDPAVIGSYIWQFADIRTAKECEMGRPRSFNNKGILNEYRKPKMAYWTVKKIYNRTD